MKQRFFITGTGTAVGKTFITASLARQARAQGLRVAAYKPVISGFDPACPAASDTGLLLDSLDLPLSPAHIDTLSPWRYAAPLAPSMAARQENRPLDFAALIAHSQGALAGNEDLVLIEGVGGVMAPLTECHTVLDWIAALQVPTVLVAGAYLGTLSHQHFYDDLVLWLRQTTGLAPLLKVPENIEVSLRQKDGARIYFLLNHQNSPVRVQFYKPMHDFLTGNNIVGNYELPPHGVLVLDEHPEAKPGG